MTRGDNPGRPRAGSNAADPLDEALRQIGADMLDEPIPERLRQVLRQARGGESESRSEPAAGASRARRPERG